MEKGLSFGTRQEKSGKDSNVKALPVASKFKGRSIISQSNILSLLLFFQMIH